jgi:hypothetical protein
MKKIAFCFLIYSEIEQEEIWNLFFKNVDPEKYNIYIHYKSNTPLTYFEKYKLLPSECIETKYADVSVPIAMNNVFRKAYNKDSDNYKFIFVTGTCIPFKSFDYIYDVLTKDNYGYFNLFPQEHCLAECNAPLKQIFKEKLAKSFGWFILNRTLVENLCFDKDDILKSIFSNFYAPEEYFYYTHIKLLNLENQVVTTNNSATEATTFINWDFMDYKYRSEYSHKKYNFISEEELLYLLDQPCLFGRKFNKSCITSLYKKIYLDRIISQ